MRDCRAIGINFAHASFANRITAKASSAKPTSPATTSATPTERCLLERCETDRNPLAGGLPTCWAPPGGSDLNGSGVPGKSTDQLQPAGLHLRQCDLPTWICARSISPGVNQ